MRTILFLIAFTISFTTRAQAAVFGANSKLPAEVQTKVTAAIAKACAKGAPLSNVREESTSVIERRIDQVAKDVYFRTDLTATYLFDVHPVGVELVVESVKSDISNPAIETIEVLSVHANSPNVCL